MELLSNIGVVNQAPRNFLQAALNVQGELRRTDPLFKSKEGLQVLEHRELASNLENARDYMHTADGWLQTINNVLERMGGLVVSANNKTNSSVEMTALKAELGQMQQTIQAITTGPKALARFNGIPLFQGDTVHFDTELSYETPNLSANSNAVIGELKGLPVTWADAVTGNGADSKAALGLAGNYVESVRAEGSAVMTSIQGLAGPLTNAFAMELLQTPGNLIAHNGHILTRA